MADFLLSVGVDVGLSFKQMQEDISGIVSQLNKNPQRIKIDLEIDSNAIKNFKTEIKSICDATNGIGNVNVAPIDTTNLSSTAKGIEQITKKTQGAVSAVHSMSAKLNSVNTQKIESALSSLEGISEKSASALAKNLSDANVEITKANAKFKESANGQQKLVSLLVQGTNAEKQAVSYLITYNQKTGEINRTLVGITAKLKETGQSTKSLVDDIDTYNAALTKVTKLLDTAKRKYESWTKAKKGKSSDAYEGYGEQIEELEKVNDKLTSHQYKTMGDLKKELNPIISSLTEYEGTVKAAGEDTLSWGDKIGGLAGKFGTWFSITQVITKVYQTIRKVVSAVIELDTAMTELKKVTDETDSAYDAFLNRATDRAKNNGATLSDTVTATADFARLGYSIEQAEKLADAAIIYKNVGDGIEDISKASESIIATMQAFDISADEIMTVVDKFNEVGKVLPNNAVMH